jgi:periplasmic protein CpxP/Spy
MKKIVLMTFAAMLALQFSGLAFANEKMMPGKGPEKRLERLTKELNLTADQKGKVEAILKEHADKSKAEMQKMQEGMKADREAMDQGIKGVLTPEQAAKFDKMQADKKMKMDKDKDGQCENCNCKEGAK